MASRSTTIAYWVSTALMSLTTFGSGVMNLTHDESVIAGLSHLGFPVYFASLLGTWKVLAVVAVLAPGMRTMKIWAYAGLFFAYTGATVAHSLVGDGPELSLPPLVFLAFALASFVTHEAVRFGEAD